MLLLAIPFLEVAGSAGSELGAALLAADFDGDGVNEVVAGAPGADAVYIWLGTGAGISGAADVTLTGDSGSRFGSAMAAVPDTDGDGLPDLAIGAPSANGGAGSVTLVAAVASGGTTVATLSSGTAGAAFGSRVAGGDVDGDGWGDVVVGGPDAGGDAGEAHLFTSAGGWGSPTWSLAGAAGDGVGTGVALGDFNGDGYDDLGLGLTGSVQGFEGGSGGLAAVAGFTSSLAEADVAAADLDGDGYEELVALSPWEGVYWYWGGSTGLDGTWEYWNSLWPDFEGSMAATLGDADGDGLADVVISVTGDISPADDLSCNCTTNYAGAIVWSGASARAGDAEEFPAAGERAFLVAPDADGDGLAELIVATGSDDLQARHFGLDADGDGWSTVADPYYDCDDADSAVNPSVEEVDGDGVDSDCDGADGIANDYTGADCERLPDWAAVEAWMWGTLPDAGPDALMAEVEALPWVWVESATDGEYECEEASSTRGTATEATSGGSASRWEEMYSAIKFDYDEGDCVHTETDYVDERVVYELAAPTAAGLVTARVATVSALEPGYPRIVGWGEFTFENGQTARSTSSYRYLHNFDIGTGQDDETTTTTYALAGCSWTERSVEENLEGYESYAASDGTHDVIRYQRQVLGWACSPYGTVWVSYDGEGRQYDEVTHLQIPLPDDDDGDGFGDADDCDDADPEVHPCNGDEWRSQWEDADGDGYGDPSLPVRSCGGVAGASSNNDDCDDSDASISPRADELCDATDRDCDGDPTAGAVDTEPLYTDNDGDGYGDGRGREMCPGTGVTVAGDCDDDDATIHRDAEEVAGDGIDQDCDGSDLPEAEPPPEEEPEPEPKEKPVRVKRNDLACATGSTPPAAALSLAAAMMSAFARRGRRLR